MTGLLARTSGCAVSAVGTEPLERRTLFSISVSFVPVTITPAAIGADPALANYKCFDLRVSVSPGDQWTGNDLQFKLTSGQFYNPSGGSRVPQPALWGSKPNLRFDTFVSAPNSTAPYIAGHAIPAAPLGTETFSSTEVNASYLVYPPMPKSTHGQVVTAGRFTVPKTADGFVYGRAGQASSPMSLVYFAYGMTDAAITASSRVAIAGSVRNWTNLTTNNFTALAGRTVYLDQDNDKVLDSTEPRTTTDAHGFYEFAQLSAGTYKVRQILPAGWAQVRPANGFGWSVTLAAGHFDPIKTFDDTNTGVIGGTVFKDLNGNGVKDGADTGYQMSGFRIFVDLDKDGVFDASEPSATTDTYGAWRIGGLTTGTYVVRILPRSGWRVTTATSRSVSIVPAQERNDVLFGEFKLA